MLPIINDNLLPLLRPATCRQNHEAIPRVLQLQTTCTVSMKRSNDFSTSRFIWRVLFGKCSSVALNFVGSFPPPSMRQCIVFSVSITTPLCRNLFPKQPGGHFVHAIWKVPWLLGDRYNDFLACCDVPKSTKIHSFDSTHNSLGVPYPRVLFPMEWLGLAPRAYERCTRHGLGSRTTKLPSWYDTWVPISLRPSFGSWLPFLSLLGLPLP